MKPIKVIHLITELNMGGAEQMLLKLLIHMDRNLFYPVVVSMTDKGPIGEKILELGIPVCELGMSLGRPNLLGFIQFAALIKKEEPDIIQTWLYHADLLGFLAGKLMGGRRVVWGIRCSNMKLKNYRLLTNLTIQACRILSPFVDGIIINSKEGLRLHVKNGYSKSKMKYIPNGFDLKRFQPNASARGWLRNELGVPYEAILIGLIARYDPMKDHETFIKAASIFLRTGKPVYFVLVGKGMEEKNRKLWAIIPENIRDRICLLGLRQDIHRITAGLDIASSSSAYGEGFPNSIGEAMACGIPCVATHVGDSAELLGNTGVVVRPGDPMALCKGWERLLLTGQEGLSQLSLQARNRITEQFEIHQVAKQFEAYYHDMLGQN